MLVVSLCAIACTFSKGHCPFAFLRVEFRAGDGYRVKGPCAVEFHLLYPYKYCPSPCSESPSYGLDHAQAGFIGSWGEWHSSMQNLHANATATAAIVEAELIHLLPPDRKLNVSHVLP